MKLNPEKCTFVITFGKFLEYLVTQRGIEANPDQISTITILEMKSPTTVKKAQILNGCLAALNRFLSRSTDKCKTFFLAIKKNRADFCWNDEYETAFQSLKAYLASLPLLSKPLPDETLFLYLAISDTAVSSTLVREDGDIQKPVYYVSKALIDTQTRYSRIAKLMFALSHDEKVETLLSILPYRCGDRVSLEDHCGEPRC